MSILIAYSVFDPAGRGIAYNIAEYSKCEKGFINDIDIEHLDNIYICRDRDIYLLGFKIDVIGLEVLSELSNKAKYYIIVSRHSAKSGKPSLTTHPSGNPWGRNDAGGRPWEMPPSNPILMWYTLKELNKRSTEYNLNNYDVCYEVTHHGPTSLSKPVTFVELGSSDKEWNNIIAQKIIALTVVDVIKKIKSDDNRCVVSVGFGGSHYAPIFTRRAFENNECYGHMIPNYVIKELTLDELRIIARKAIELTPNVRRVVIEKMRSEVRKVIEDEASVYGLEIIRY